MAGPALLRELVLVTGAPGAGKSTLAGPLAVELGFALVSKDLIKEQLHDSLPPVHDDPLRSSRRFGAAAMELLWVLAKHVPCIVLEATFRPRSEHEQAKLRELGGRVVEVHCAVPAAEAVRRYNARAHAGHRHPTHVLSELKLDVVLREFWGPVGIGELLQVDTSIPVDVPTLAEHVRTALEAQRVSRSDLAGA